MANVMMGSDPEFQQYMKERTEKSVILSFGKQFNKGGPVVVGKNVDKDLL